MSLTCKGDLDWGTSQRYTDTNGVVWHRVANGGCVLVHNNNGAARVLLSRHHRDPLPIVPAKEGAVEFARDIPPFPAG